MPALWTAVDRLLITDATSFPAFASADEGGGGGCGCGGVRQCDEAARGVEGLEQGEAVAVEDNRWGFSWVVHDFDVLPGEVCANAGSERLRNGFFGGESGGVRGDGVCEGGAVGLFACGEESVEEGFAVAFDGGAEAVDFNEVEADAEQFSHDASGGEVHEANHFPHGFGQAGEEAASDDGVSDVEVDEVRDTADERDVGVVDSVAGVDL